MPSRPLLVFCLRRSECPLVKALKNAAESGEKDCSDGAGFSLGTPPLAARLLRTSRYPDLGYTELWVRVSGSRPVLNRFLNNMKRLKGVYHQVVYENKFNKVMRVVVSHDSREVCPLGRRGSCPLNVALPGAMVKSLLLLPEGILYELIVARSNVLDVLRGQWGCEILDVRGLDEMDYMLTEKQELAIIYAYMSGYYNFPRRVSLKALAERLGLSVSTLAEFLRRAEAKIIDAYVRHELPHYMAAMILYGPKCLESIEAALSGGRNANGNGSDNGAAKKEEALAAARGQ